MSMCDTDSGGSITGPIYTFNYSTVFKDGTNGVDGLGGAKSVTVSPDGNNVYVGGWDDDALAVFNRNTTTGALTYSTNFKDGQDGQDGVDGLGHAISVTVSPDGNNVYVAGYNDDALAVFNRNTTTGALTYSTVFKDGTNGVDGLKGAYSVTVSPDGNNVYVAGFDDDALAVFNRNTTTGALTYSTVFKNGTNGVDGLDGPAAVMVSPDGENVYVAGYNDDAVAVFNRNTTTGVLTYSTVLKDGVNGVDGLDGPVAVTVSPDGNNVYVVSLVDDALAVFNRNTTTGVLTYSTVLKDGTNGVDGLDGAKSVTVSPDGNNVYVVSSQDDALAVFNRNTTTGALNYSTIFKDGTNGVDGLDGAYSVTVSPDGNNIYVVSEEDDALAVFNRSSSQ
ncbi:6-phosphogluconolactonase-like [Ylistrum balloti]|uniref:6-phosphogluconolactonase-like n=1 Tax=Ylistrum balloti TaxID=509963 RepID=UPI002905E47A|nr:6-phosphogluconolactonase-like [Ylistrum balloti]